MGCSSSRDVRDGVVFPSAVPAERRQGLRSHSVTRTGTATALTSLGMCRGGHESVHAYTALPSEEPVKGAHDPATAEEALPGEDAAASSWTAQWSAEPAPSSLPPLDLDPALLVFPGFRQPMQVPSPSHPEQENPEPQEATEEFCDDVDMGTPAARDIPEVTGFVRARVGEFLEKVEKKVAVAAEDDNDNDNYKEDEDEDVTALRRRLPQTGKPVVLYFTSLRGVRRTFEDCRAVRTILRCYRVRLDERDVSMHAAFKSELRGLLGAGFEGPMLPRVFVEGRHDLGGAENVRALHEAGELARVLARCEVAPQAGLPGHVGACAACGEARFLPCETCHGSCKVFVDDEGWGCRLGGFFRQCPDCNENGLIRCPVCCY